MESLVINGFVFPNSLQAREAIAHVCKRIVVDSMAEGVSYRTPGMYRYDWKHNCGRVYNNATLNNTQKRHFLNDYFDPAERSSKSGDGKLWTISSGNTYLVANEWTGVVANKLTEIHKQRKESQQVGKEYRVKRMQQIFKNADLQSGDVVCVNKNVFTLTYNQIYDCGSPDTYYVKNTPSGENKDNWRTVGMNKWTFENQGILLGFEDIKTWNGVTVNAAVVMFSDRPAPVHIDARMLQRA